MSLIDRVSKQVSNIVPNLMDVLFGEEVLIPHLMQLLSFRDYCL